MRQLLSAALTAFITSAVTASAFAHAHLAGSVPTAGSTVNIAPSEVSLRFTEAVEPQLSSIEVQDALGQRVDSGRPHLGERDSRLLVIRLKPLAASVYTVIWHATSVDTHKTEGSFRFTVQP